MKQWIQKWGPALSGAIAGAANGLFGAGGGMLLLPLLTHTTRLEKKRCFACSVCIMLPLSLVSVAVYWLRGGRFAAAALPYLCGGALGGCIAGLLLRRLPTRWLRRFFALLLLWGGARLLWAG